MADAAISVVVIAYRQREALARCLESVLAAGEQVEGGIELIVVDNGGLADFVRECCPPARVVEPGRNLGFAGGVVAGAAAAGADWFALVNDDAHLDAGALRALLEAGRRDARIGAVAAQVRFAAAPGVVNSAGIGIDTLGVASERFAGRPAAAAAAAAAGPVFGASGSVVLYRAAMLEQIGGFDERFFAYLEDADVAWRARAAGWSAWYEPSALAYHEGSASTVAPEKYLLVGRNRVRLLARNMTRRQLARSLPAIVLYDCAYVAYVALRDRTLAPLRGRLDGLRHWRGWRRETAASRREVELEPALRGIADSWRMQRAYRRSS